jgi:hypothetical protein
MIPCTILRTATLMPLGPFAPGTEAILFFSPGSSMSAPGMEFPSWVDRARGR